MKVIDADKLPVHKAYCVDEAGFGANFYVVDKEDIDNAPTIDAVPVVRCKDCQKAKKHEIFPHSRRCSVEDFRFSHKETHFCSYGERRTE